MVGYCKGFYIKGDIKNLETIQFSVSTHPYFKYDKLTIDCISETINENMIYIPFNIHSGSKEFAFSSLHGSLNIGKCENMNFDFTFSTEQNEITLYGNIFGCVRFDSCVYKMIM